MDLEVDIRSDFNGTISITNKSEEISNGYITDESVNIIKSPNNFKYELTCTIDIIHYSSTDTVKLIDSLFVEHVSYESDSVRIALPQDGHFTVDHVVLPTKDWLIALHDKFAEDLTNALFGWTDSDNVYHAEGLFDHYNKGIFIVDIKKYDSDNNLLLTPLYKIYKVNLVLDANKNIDLKQTTYTPQGIGDNSDFDVLISSISTLEDTTVSMTTYNIFNIVALKDCYVKASLNILNQVPKCGKIEEMDKFNRDFLWMTINVINIWIEKDEYDMALIVLERLGCYNFCPNILESTSKNSDCGCHKQM